MGIHFLRSGGWKQINIFYQGLRIYIEMRSLSHLNVRLSQEC